MNLEDLRPGQLRAILAKRCAEARILETKIKLLNKLHYQTKHVTKEVHKAYNNLVDDFSEVKKTQKEQADQLIAIKNHITPMKRELTDENPHIDAQSRTDAEEIEEIRKRLAKMDDEETLRRKIHEKKQSIAEKKLFMLNKAAQQKAQQKVQQKVQQKAQMVEAVQSKEAIPMNANDDDSPDKYADLFARYLPTRPPSTSVTSTQSVVKAVQSNEAIPMDANDYDSPDEHTEMFAQFFKRSPSTNTK